MKLIKKLFILPSLVCLPTISLFSCGTNKDVEPVACFLKEQSIMWRGEHSEYTQLHPIIYPEGCHPKLIYESSDPVNLCVTDTGFVYVRGALPKEGWYNQIVSVYPQGHKELTAYVHISCWLSDDPTDPMFRDWFVFNSDNTNDERYWLSLASFCKDLKKGVISQEVFCKFIPLENSDGTLYYPQSLRDYLGAKRKILLNGIYQEVQVIGVNEDYQINGSAPIFTFQFTHPVCDSDSKPVKVKWDSKGSKNYWSSDIRQYLNVELFSQFSSGLQEWITPVSRKAITYQNGHWGVTADIDLLEAEGKHEKMFLPTLTDIYDYDDLNMFYKDENIRYNPDLGYKNRQYSLYKKNVKDSKREKANASLIKTDLEGNPCAYWLASPSAFEFYGEDKLVNVITEQGINDYSTYSSDRELCILPCFCI